MGLSLVLIHQVSAGSKKGLFMGRKYKVKGRVGKNADGAETMAGQAE